jgi:hypothetical protein
MIRTGTGNNLKFFGFLILIGKFAHDNGKNQIGATENRQNQIRLCINALNSLTLQLYCSSQQVITKN